MGTGFIASYSGGKDSVLSVYRAIKMGYTPIALITTYNTDRERSWFHGIPERVLDSLSSSLGIPVWLVKTDGASYAENFESVLQKARSHGAELCVFGDIDIEGHREWCTARCEAVSITPMFPLWGERRRVVVSEFIELGFTANITVIDTSRLSGKLLGQRLTEETLLAIAAEGADECGENGEYHSFVSAGPLFKKPVRFSFGERLSDGGYEILPVLESDDKIMPDTLAGFDERGQPAVADDGGVSVTRYIKADMKN